MISAGATATPGDTPMPRKVRGISGLPEAAGHQLHQRRHRLLGVGTVGADGDLAAALGGQHHDAHDALSVHADSVFHDLDLGGEAARQPNDAGGGPGVQPLLVHDGGGTLDHGKIPRKSPTSRIASRAKPPVVSAPPSPRVTATPVAATASVPSAPAHPMPRRYQVATSGSAKPTANPAIGPTLAIAPGIQDWAMAAPTFIPLSYPVRSAQIPVSARATL